ncbi:unnamed protein product [Choristocarpus tenellus]
MPLCSYFLHGRGNPERPVIFSDNLARTVGSDDSFARSSSKGFTERPTSRSCWLTDTQNIPVPPSKSDFEMVGNLQKRRGGFGKIAQHNWKDRCFVLLKSGNLCYFEARLFESVDFCSSPRGILTLDEDITITKFPKQDGDGTGDSVMVIAGGGGQKWKLSSEKPGEIDRWEKALRDMIVRGNSQDVQNIDQPMGSVRSLEGIRQKPSSRGESNGAQTVKAAIKALPSKHAQHDLDESAKVSSSLDDA